MRRGAQAQSTLLLGLIAICFRGRTIRLRRLAHFALRLRPPARAICYLRAVILSRWLLDVILARNFKRTNGGSFSDDDSTYARTHAWTGLD
ncbi:hypothetical protein B0H16DRAFT_1589031 [Mycena metata]|uniref:Uncharacterized protein n=1 Tax=Mycena metata TaxID=1033252 RepID=A0AAD7GQJ4_9AGAR|nr:hypothetical protein B0H16DRAFT_1638799 [Mycena metata]KAJ7728343.1 hypothetical protein B0H16DRAFT_1589031 [Mycena metata]